MPNRTELEDDNWMRQVETYIKDHPMTGIGAAFCIGVFLGWVVKRR